MPVYDPTPNWRDAGWQVEGTGQPPATGPVVDVVDPSAAAGEYTNMFHAGADFASELVLTPRVALDNLDGADPADGNLGVHATLNDGATNKLARAVLLKVSNSAMRVAILLNGRYVPSLASRMVFPTLEANFELKRDPLTGNVTLRAMGDTEPVGAADLPASTRPSTLRTVDFGSYGDPRASGTSRWTTLGLAKLPVPVTAGITLDELRIRDAATNDRIRLECQLTLASTSDGINPATENVSLKFIATDGTVVYQTPQLTGFTVHGQTNHRRWSLPDSLRASTNIESFNIRERGNNTQTTIHFADRNTSALPPFPTTSPGRATLRVELVVGNDRGVADANLIEQPAGSGRWRRA